MRVVFLLAATAIGTPAFAQDPQLDELRATLQKMRSLAKARIDDPAINPHITVAKHRLRDWIEKQLELRPDEPEALFAARLNQALQPIGNHDPKDDLGVFGSIGEVRVGRSNEYLTLMTGVGIVCQFDESAYVYRIVNRKWNRIWQKEEDIAAKQYSPHHLSAVHILQSYRNGSAVGDPYVLTLGYFRGCASAWHPVIYRVWRVGGTGSKLLIDRTEQAYLRTGAFIMGSIVGSTQEDTANLLVEFTQRSIDAGVHSRQAVRQFRIQQDRVIRIAPFALSPRDFIDEWLTLDWKQTSSWSASASLESWHRRLHSDFVSGDFLSQTTLHCQTPDRWQVALELRDIKEDFGSRGKLYFLVRWRPPYDFTLMDIGDKPWPRCTEADTEADRWRTLFATQDWLQ